MKHNDYVLIEESRDKLEKWIEGHEYKAYEPFDGQLSYLHWLTFNNEFLERVLQQIVRRSRINLRPLLGIKPKESTKGRGYIARAYLIRAKTHNGVEYSEKSKGCLKWLVENKSSYSDELSWGNHFRFTSRGGRLEKYEPIIVWTSLIGHAFLDYYDMTGEDEFLQYALSIGNWILGLPREKTESGDCLSYIMRGQSSIHNSNMLGAGYLSRLSHFHKEPEKLKTVAMSAMEYSCSRQRSDGSWLYGEKDYFHWVDNFHTGYNLDSLLYYEKYSGDQSYHSNLESGARYYLENFFDSQGRPAYYSDKMYPIDSQCMSQSVETLTRLSHIIPDSLEKAVSVALWSIENMQHSSGYYYFRKYPFSKDKTPMLHWSQATMYYALSYLLETLKEEELPQ